jgi:hypothetical protein
MCTKRRASAIDVKIENLAEDAAKQQYEIAALRKGVANIKLERAAERGYIAGAMAV